MITTLLLLALLPFVLPGFSLLALTLAASSSHKTSTDAAIQQAAPRGRVAVLVPAHNESRNVLPTIACLLRELRSDDQLLVIADNCDDDTADLAREAGALVLVRDNKTQRGKGYALAFGVDHLRDHPPDVVMVVDADCLVSQGAVDALAARCILDGAPVQILNLMDAPDQAPLKFRLLAFAMLMKNLVRPLGAQGLGGACHLMGTGMAIPWHLAAQVRWATGHIAEDMKLGIELASQGHPTQFMPSYRISSAFPTDTHSAKAQKSRWEHGHLDVIREELPALVWRTFSQRNIALFTLAMDLMIPPLAFYCAVLAAITSLSLVAGLAWPTWWPVAGLALTACVAVAMAVLLAWYRFGRHLLSARELFTAPMYIVWKLPVYIAYFLKRKSGWVRTKRESE